MRKLITAILLFTSVSALTQTKEEPGNEMWKKISYATETKINDLVNTRLAVTFNFARSWMNGKVWLTLHPHFYNTDSLNLDAKGMTIEEVSLVLGNKKIPLHYSYDSLNLRITLNKVYHSNENYTIYIQYISKPNEYKANVYSMMSGEKGLYFINPLGDIKGKPTQVWTQGETEANSYWVPTIDKPNQKTTDQITITVPAKYLTLSNGLLTSQKTNSDGTRSDTWKMDLPHAPYLMFMGVGEYSVIKDSYKGKEVSYYVEKEYAPFARKIFGNTPEMIALFSRLTGVDYPWPKYAQITGRDYIFGAMENTSATLHEESSQEDARELVDGNRWEDVISHELFHQWFGDYVTTESWSNITVNESFADYGETLWNEYKYGKEAGQANIYSDLRNYLGNPANAEENLVRYHYKNVFEAFDAVTYQKGGCILNMLRNYLGDSAFFRSLNVYLSTNKYKSAEAQNLRLAFEEVTGQDLNWFFNQWYYNHGHPKLDISYDYDNAGKTVKIFIRQTQKETVFKLPFAIDVYEGTGKKRYNVWANDTMNVFSFPAIQNPYLVNVDADKILVCEKTDHKTAENFIYQYNNAGSYIDRREAISFFINHKDESKRMEFLQTALKDKNDRLRGFTIQHLDPDNDTIRRAMEPALVDIIKTDSKTQVRADAIAYLGSYKRSEYKPIFIKGIADSSYTVAGVSLEALAKIDSVSALSLAKSLSGQKAKGVLQTSILSALGKWGDESSNSYIYNSFNQAGINAKFRILASLTDALIREKNVEEVKNQVDIIVNFRDDLPEFTKQFAEAQINGSLIKIAAAKESSGSAELTNYIQSKLPAQEPAPKEVEVSTESLQKYTGEYDLSGTTIKIVVKDNALHLLIPGQPEYAISPIGENKFSINTLYGYTLLFNTNAGGIVTEMISIQPNGRYTAKKTK